MQRLQITIELLNFLKNQGVIAILKKWEDREFNIISESETDIIFSLNTTPMREDIYIPIDDAIQFIDEISDEFVNVNL